MPVQLVTLPESSALTMGGRMIFQFQGSGRTITTGTKAVCVLIVTGPVPDGYSRKISWKGQTETIVFKSAPLEPNEFPAGDGSPAYVDQLAEQLAEYFPFYNDYVVERSNEAVTPGIKFSAREPGAKYTFSLDAQPESAPIKFGFAFAVGTDGADPLLRTEYSIYAELWVQKDQTEGLTQADFRKVAPVTIRTDASGLARWDVGAMLHAELTPDSPNWTLPIAKRAFNSHKKYFIRYAEAWGSPIRNSRVKTDVTRNAYLGGVSYEEKASGGFQLTNYVKLGTPAQDQALRYGSKTRYVRIDEPQFLTFINLRASLKASLEVSLKFSDGSTLVLMDQIPPFDFGTSEKWSMPVGIDQLGLLAKVPAGKSLVEYQVRLCQTSTVNYLSAPYRYIVNGRHEPYTRYFAFVNSLGAIDTLPTFGRGSSELTRYFEQADRFLPAFYPVEHGQLIDHNISVQQQLEVSTGFCSQKELDRWLDFYLSPTRYHLVEDKALPISISSKTIKEAKDGDTTFSNVFQFVYLFRDDFYTYAGDPDLEGDGEPPLGFVPGGNVTITVPQVVYAVDNTVPNVVRTLTPELIDMFVLAARRPNPETLGFLKQASADALYRPKGVKIDYDTDLINTPVIPEVPVVNLQVATDNGSVTSRAIKAGGFGRPSFTSVAMPEAFATISKNGPQDLFIEMTYPADVRNLLGVVRSILSGAKTGQQVLLRIAPDGSPEFIFADRDTLHSVLSRGNVSDRPMVTGGLGRMNQPTKVGFVNRFAVWTDTDQNGNTFIEYADAVEVFTNGFGLISPTTLYNRIREKVLADIAASGSTGGGGTITSSIRYYLEEIRCFQEQVNGGRDSNGWPLDPAQRRDYFLKLLAEIGLEGAVPPGESTAPVVIPTVTRYSARIRQIYADESVATISEYIVFAPGETPVLGGVLNRILLPSERITGELFGSHSQNACQGTGIAPPYTPPAAAKTYQVVRLWKQRPIPTGPSTGTPDARYEAGIGVVVAVNGTGGYPFVRLVPLDGQNFSGTAWFTPDLFDGTPPAASTFSRYFQNLPGGLYRADARAFGTSIDAPYKSATVRVPNGSPTNRAPIVASRYPDQVVSGSDDATLPAIAGTFSDPDGDTLTYSMAKVVNQTTTEALPAGISLDSAKARPVVARTVADTSVVLRLFATDPGGLRAQSDFLLTVKRKKIQSLVFVSVPASVDEGAGFQWSAKATYNDGTVVDDIRSQGVWSLALAAGNFQAAVVTLEGVTLGSNGLMGVAADSISGNTRSYRIRCTYDGVSAEATVQVNDKTITTNRAPYIYFEMPDVPITTAGLKTFALPDDHIRDPDGDALTLLITQTDGSPLPVWLSYNPPTRTFTKADGFGAGSCAVAVKATDPGGLSVTDTFLVVVQAESPPAVKPAIDIEVVSQGNGQLQINMFYRTPNASWQRFIQMSGDPNVYGWGRVDANGAPVNGYYTDLYGQPSVGQTLEIRLSPDGINDIVTRTYTVTGVQARTNLYTAP